MKESKVSQRSFEEKSHLNSMDSSLMGKVLDDEIQLNNVQIDHMEAFLQQKYSQIGDLQTYLMGELQEIQNCKDRNKRIETILISTVLPTLQDIREALKSFRPLFDPFQLMTANYVEAVAEKCKSLIIEKELKIQEYRVEVEKLKNQVFQLKEKIERSESSVKVKDTEPKQMEKKINGRTNFVYRNDSTPQLEVEKSNFQIKSILSQKSFNISLIKKSSAIADKAKISFNMISNGLRAKSPPQLDQYEECYRQILQHKNINIKYRCEKSPTFNECGQERKSVSSKKLGRVEPANEKKDRKSQIKQKIERIKCRAERGERVLGRRLL